jgi:hypothetical protein
MNLFRRISISGWLLLSIFNYSLAQPGAPGYVDNALNYNRLIIAKTSEGFYKLIGVYKVIGTSYLFGEHNKGDMFSSDTKAYNVFISYNSYNQEVEFYSSSNPDKPLVKEPGTIDSFIIQSNIELGIFSPLKFVYGSILGTKDKYYYQEVSTGHRFCLYKRYRSQLGYVSSNYIQSELRQFDLEYEYYYTDTENKGIKKIKANAASVIKEFKDIKDLSAVISVDDFSVNPESAFRKAFDFLNN